MSENQGKGSKKKTWERKKRWPPCLWRHRSGDYYARFKIQGQDHWESLKTKSVEVAKSRLAEVRIRAKAASNRNEAPSVRQALIAAVEEIRRDPDRPETTIRYYSEQKRAIFNTFPNPDLRLDKVKPSHMREWHVLHKAQIYLHHRPPSPSGVTSFFPPRDSSFGPP